MGSTLGISISGLVFFQGLAGVNFNGIPASQAVGRVRELPEPQRSQAISLFSKGMRDVHIQLTVVLSVAFLASLLVKRHKLQDKVQSKHRLVEQES